MESITSTDAPFTITSLSSIANEEAFRAINEEWISRLFSLADADRTVLEDPRGQIVDTGGDILIARDGRGGAELRHRDTAKRGSCTPPLKASAACGR